MARWTGHTQTAEVLAAAETWKQACLLDSGGVFITEASWTEEALMALRHAVVESPLLGNESFYSKLEKQLAGADRAVIRLAAEMLWVLFLFPHESRFGTKLKRERIAAVWSLSREPLPQTKFLDSIDVLRGIGSPGTAFNTLLHAELGYLINAVIAFKALPADQRADLLSNAGAWRFCELLTSIEGGTARATRHMLLFLCFPDRFERIASRDHKQRIYEVFKQEIPPGEDEQALRPTPCNLDKALLTIRKRLSATLQTDELDFYSPPLSERWNPASTDPEAADQTTTGESPTVWVEKTLVRGRPDREKGPHRLGEALWSPQRSKDNRDIYSNMRRVAPGDIVLHLTDNEAITGISRAANAVDDSFMGVESTAWGVQPSYRIQLGQFTPVDPPLGREAMFGDEQTSVELRRIADVRGAGVFYNSNLELNQGAYLTEAPAALVEALQAAYQRLAGKPLPHLDPAQPRSDPRPNKEWTVRETLEPLFLDDELAAEIVDTWAVRKNIILQGAPGVGKTFAARLLARALIGERDDSKIQFVQFHQSYSYEDFVQGYRPTATGFALKNGRFVEFCERARADERHRYVFVIDEINRGNLSKILGELLLLIEEDKRSPEWAVPLAYATKEAPAFFVPGNVFLLGLMNTADRSLAVVDYALRRRFAFFDLAPMLLSEKFGAYFFGAGGTARVLSLIRERVGALNSFIVGDTTNLGPGFAIGHSFFCPQFGLTPDERWYRRVVETQVLPLLREYWFDDPTRVKEWEGRLLVGV